MYSTEHHTHSDHNKKSAGLFYPTMITAHAGAEDTAPNTAESIRLLLACGADAVEVDVRMHDGTLCLSHDMAVSGSDYTSLKEAFDLLSQSHDVMMNIDIKSAGLITDILNLARQAGIAHRLVFTGDVGPEDLGIILNNEIPLWFNNYLLPLLEWGNPVKAVEKRGFSIVNTDKRRLTDKMLSEQANRFSVWTVNDEEMLRSLLKAEVKNITTKQPLLALKLRKEIQKPIPTE